MIGSEPSDTPAVDVHAHHVSRDLLLVDKRFNARRDATWGESLYFDDRFLGPLIPRLTELSLMIEDMDAARITHRLCCTASWLNCYWAEPELGQALCRAINETIARGVAEHPGRLTGLATLPLQDVERAVAELRYGVQTLGLAGASAGTNVNGVYFDDPRFDPFFQCLEELDVPLFFHPDDVAGADRMRDYWLVRLLGNPHEAALSLSRIILGGVLERHPRLKLCFPMGGGSISQLLGRVIHGWQMRPEARVRAPRRPDEYLRRCYFDTILHSEVSLEFLLRTVPPEHVVMGSDYPWDMGQAQPRSFIEASGLPAETQQAVLGGNIGRLLMTDFRIPVPEGPLKREALQ